MTNVMGGQHEYALADRYRLDRGRVFLSGVQALARVPVEQLRADRRAGWNTAAFLSGYPGSPLGGFDREAKQAAAAAPDLPIVVRPAVNEELAATAIMGTQLAGNRPDSRYDGVVGIWYGKTPGLDRAGDAIRHGVFAGADRRGGAVLFVGDDPVAKSSTLPGSSDATLLSLYVPMFDPGDVQDVIELGRHAVALSRVGGLWTAVRVVTAVADGTGTVELHGEEFSPVLPVVERGGVPMVPPPSGRLLAPESVEAERDLVDLKLEIARDYGVLNGLNRVTVDPSDAWLGVVASGHTYFEVIEALQRLGLGTPAEIESAGVRLLQLRMPLPMDAQTVRHFARGLREVLVVEDKRPTVETLVRNALYGGPDQPLVVGKRDEQGRQLLPSHGSLDADQLIEPLRARLLQRLSPGRLRPPPRPTTRALIPLSVNRTPYFCSGCPHNTSAKVPDGTLVGGGIGCSSLLALMPADQVGELVGLCAMGAEGATWIGMAPFVETPHLVQTLGDGTYAHSGHLAIRATVAARVNITYKILYNGAVSMTGGQHAEGIVEVPQLARLLLSEGVARVLITTDDMDRYERVDLPGSVEVWDRSRIVEAQEVLARVVGTTVLIHDQACAAEKRRARKRGTLPRPTSAIVINQRVCEGCGDCGRASNCLSVQPVDTPFGRATTIDQSSCNHDMSCLDGDCPSFATVIPKRRRGKAPAPAHDLPPIDDLPVPNRLTSSDAWTVRLSGIGGTGVVTMSQVIGTAALLDGLDVRGLDQTGLSQKAGPVVSDLRIGRDVGAGSNKAVAGGVDVALAFDLLAAGSAGHLAGARPGHTIVIGSRSIAPTGAMVLDPTIQTLTSADLVARLDAMSAPEHNRYLDAAGLAEGLFADAAAANVIVLGVAIQIGALPLDPASIERSLELNGVAVAKNLAAFRWGRRWAVEPGEVERAAGRPDGTRVETVDELIERLAVDLEGYQSRSYADRFRSTVASARAAERTLTSTEDSFATAVARNLHRLMAYKDEYEVARLLLAPEAKAAAEAVGGRGAKVVWHLHPPVLHAFGLDRKLEMGPWARPMLRVLRPMRRLRGTRWDPFGRTGLRRLERSLVTEFEAALDQVIAGLTVANHAEAVAIASLPDQVRGYETLKLQRAADYRVELARRVERYTG